MVWSIDKQKGEGEGILEGGGGIITNCTVSIPVHTNCTTPLTDEQHATHHRIFIHIGREIDYPRCVPWYTTIAPTDHYKYIQHLFYPLPVKYHFSPYSIQ